MKPVAGIVAPARSLAEIANQYDLIDGNEQRSLAEFRKAKAKLLIEARADPKWGARGDGFVEFVEKRLRENYQTAYKWMVAAGWKPPKEPGAGRKAADHYRNDNDRRTECRAAEVASDDGPTEAVTTPSRQWAPSISPSVEPVREPSRAPVGDDDGPIWTEEQRRAAYAREVEASMPPRMAEREQRTNEWIEIAREVRALACRFDERNIHLKDVSTSPDDFMRAKQLAIDVVNRFLAELDAAGVLDKKEGRRQLQLLDGGKR